MKIAMRAPRAVLIAAAASAAALVLAACGNSASSNSSQAPLAGEQELKSAMSTLIGAGGPPGVVVIVQDGTNRYELVDGKADVTTGTAMTGSATSRIASISKVYSGAILLDLASEGKLSLDAPISTLLPTVPNAWGAATVSQVLQHTSGIPDYIKDPKFLKQFIADPQMQRTPQQLIGYVAKQPLNFAPGSTYEYSDTDNIVAGLIAEQILGKPYAEILQDVVAQPMSLANTNLPSTSDLPEGYIHGYAVEPPAATGAATAPPEDVSLLINPGLAWASGGMISTADDMNTFIRGYLAGDLFNANVLTDSNAFVPGGGGPPGPGTNSSGLAIYRYETACGTVFGHTGNMPGYTQFFGASQDGSKSVVVTVNSQISPKNAPTNYENLIAVQNQAICSAMGQASASASASNSAS